MFDYLGILANHLIRLFLSFLVALVVHRIQQVREIPVNLEYLLILVYQMLLEDQGLQSHLFDLQIFIQQKNQLFFYCSRKNKLCTKPKSPYESLDLKNNYLLLYLLHFWIQKCNYYNYVYAIMHLLLSDMINFYFLTVSIRITYFYINSNRNSFS